MNKDLHTKHNGKSFNEMNIEEKIMWRSGHYNVPGFLSKEKAFEKLMSQIANTETIMKTPVIKLKPRYLIASLAAAVIIGFVSVWLFLINKPVENVIAEKGHHSEYRLPDGSMVALNADTKISFNKAKFDKKRNVKLVGEAFFNVEKGNTFTISTNMGDIKILGTSFNVYARDNSFKVSCFTGKISVTSGTQSVIIMPTETAYLENNKLFVQQEDNINSTAKWRVGEFGFENTSLNLVFEEIERQFNVNFVLPNIGNKTFTGSISNKNLVNALDIICIPMGLTYEIGSNSIVYIKNKPD